MSSPTATDAPPEGFSAARRPLRRLTLELFGIVALKIAALTLIWWVAFAPQPKPDASPGAVAQRLAPAAAPPEAKP